MMKFLLQFVTKQGDGSGTKHGFTMIELLIVIAILGILAVAVLSAINPVEQINRGRDTGSRSDAEQFLSAIDRYNAFTGYYPWQDGAADLAYAVAWTNLLAEDELLQNTTGCLVSDLLSAGDGAACVGSNELKVTFFSRIFGTSYNYLKIFHDTDPSDSTYVCFTPRSDAFKAEAAARVAAGLPDDYPVTAATANVTNCGDDGNCVCLP